MGNLVFIVLHIVALIFFAGALVITIPLHIIYQWSADVLVQTRQGM